MVFNRGILSPRLFFPFIVFFLLIFGILANLLRAEVIGAEIFIFDQYVYIATVLLVVAGLIFYQFGHFLFFRRFLLLSSYEFNAVFRPSVFLYFIRAYFFCALFVYLFFFYRAHGVPLFGVSWASVTSGYGYVYVVIDASLFTMIGIFYLVIKDGGRNKKELTVYLFVLFVADVLLLSRGKIIFFIFYAFMLGVIIGRFRWRSVFLSILVVASLASYIGQVRDVDDPEARITSLLVIRVVNELLVEVSNLLLVVEKRFIQDYEESSTMSTMVTRLIPRFLYPEKDKHIGAGQIFKIEYSDRQHIKVGERITIFGELIMNFPLHMYLFVLFVLGVVTALLNRLVVYNFRGLEFLYVYLLAAQINIYMAGLGEISPLISSLFLPLLFVLASSKYYVKRS